MHLRIIAGLSIVLGLSTMSMADPLGTAFTYQGRLKSGGSPANGSFNMDFKLYPVPAGGTLLASQTLPGVSVTDGLFTVQVDFGAGVFDGNQRWLDVTVDGTPLVPRQEVTATPYALQTRGIFVDNAGKVGIGTTTPFARLAVEGGGLSVFDSAGQGVYLTSDEIRFANATNEDPAYRYTYNPEQHDFFVGGNSVLTIASSGIAGSGAGLTNLNASNINSGTLAEARLSSNVALLDREQSFTDTQHFNQAPEFLAAGLPFTVESSGLVPNLNADLLDGLDSTAFLHWSAVGADLHNTNAGNVGIGTATPQAKLHIAGVPDNDGIMFPDGTLQVSASPWRVRPDKTFYLDGLVGIGTQDPTALLHLKPTLDQTSIRIEADRYVTAPDSVSDASATATQVNSSDASWASPGLAGTLNGASATATVTTPGGDDETNELDWRNFGFNVPTDATISQVRVEVTGSQSGSCTSCGGPYARLEFFKTARLANGGTLGSTRTNRSTVVSTSLGTTNDLWGLALTPAIVNSANFGVRLRVRMIPVSTYYDFTHPNGAPFDCPGCTANATVGIDGIQVTIYYGTPTLAHAEYTVGIGPDGRDFRISPSSDFSAPGLQVLTNGDVDIGASTGPSHFLTVYGGASKNGGGSWSSISDARLKRNIAPLEGTLDRLLTLRGYSFEFTDEAVAHHQGLPGRQMGLIAQEVEQVFPNWIDYTKDGYRMVTERATTALLVEALRDLRAEKDRQLAERDARVAALATENAELRIRLERIEQALAEGALEGR